MSYTPKNPNGQATMANSSPVVVSSNQSSIPVTITPATPGQGTMANSTSIVVASDQTPIQVWGSSIYSATPSTAFYDGNRASTVLQTAATPGHMIGSMSDKYGRKVVLNGTIRDLVGTQSTTISSSTSETTIVTAAASTYNDLTTIVVSNTSSTTPTRVDFRDTTGGAVLFSLYVPYSDMRGISFQRPIPQTNVNTNWTAQCASSVSDIRIYAVYDKNR